MPQVIAERTYSPLFVWKQIKQHIYWISQQTFFQMTILGVDKKKSLIDAYDFCFNVVLELKLTTMTLLIFSKTTEVKKNREQKLPSNIDFKLWPKIPPFHAKTKIQNFFEERILIF